jgi:integrase
MTATRLKYLRQINTKTGGMRIYKPMLQPKYTGLHALRHFYASWCINRREDGGLELPPKVVQHRLGHSSIMVTMDTYGHLFPRTDDGSELAAAETALLS